MRTGPVLLIAAGIFLAPFASAEAFGLEDALRDIARGADTAIDRDLEVTQGNGKSLSEAIEQVRRRTNGRIVGAETRISGNREVHYIKVLTADGKVKSVRVPGRSSPKKG